MSNSTKRPLVASRGGGNDEAAGNLPLPLDYTTTESPCQPLGLAGALISLERRLADYAEGLAKRGVER